MSAAAKTVVVPAMKVRAWQLQTGQWLVLLFMRRCDDLLLMQELEVPDEEAVQQVVRDTMRDVEEAMRAAGLNGTARAQFPGSEEA